MLKRILKYSIAVAACVVAFASCAKQDLESEALAPKTCTITAYLPGCETKTQIGSVDLTNYTTVVNWSENDKISVWGDTNNEFTIYSGVGTNSGAVFNCSNYSGSAEYGLYPYDSYATCDTDKKIITTTVPYNQEVTENMYDPDAAIMVGTVDDLVVTFHHAVAYLRITAPTNVEGLESITIESNDGTQLTGDAQFLISDGSFKGKGTFASRYVTIEATDGFKAGAIYYAAVIPGNYAQGLTVRYMYKSGTTMVEKSKGSTHSLDLENKQGWTKLIGAANTGLTESVVAEQLYENGPYWSTANVGASTPTEQGRHFAWGYAIGYTYDATAKAWVDDDGKTITFDKNGVPDYSTHKYVDAAEANLGRGWREPTVKDFTDLIANIANGVCTLTYQTDGSLKVEGKVDWKNNSVIFPAAGLGSGSEYNGLTQYLLDADGNRVLDEDGNDIIMAADSSLGHAGWYWTSEDSTGGPLFFSFFNWTYVYESETYEVRQYYAVTKEMADEAGLNFNNKYWGASIRPVHY